MAQQGKAGAVQDRGTQGGRRLAAEECSGRQAWNMRPLDPTPPNPNLRYCTALRASAPSSHTYPCPTPSRSPNLSPPPAHLQVLGGAGEATLLREAGGGEAAREGLIKHDLHLHRQTGTRKAGRRETCGQAIGRRAGQQGVRKQDAGSREAAHDGAAARGSAKQQAATSSIAPRSPPAARRTLFPPTFTTLPFEPMGGAPVPCWRGTRWLLAASTERCTMSCGRYCCARWELLASTLPIAACSWFRRSCEAAKVGCSRPT